MHKTLFSLGPLEIHSYGFLLALSFALGLWLAARRAEARGIPSEKIMDLTLVIIACVVVGARALFVAAHPAQFAGRWLDVLKTWEGGLTMYGGAVPAVVVGMWLLRRWGIDPWAAADSIAPSIGLGLGLTRIGCYLSGCCLGAPTEASWAVVFPDSCYLYSGSPLSAGTPVHPAQLYASAVGFFLFAFLMLLDRRPLRRGSLLLTFLLLYSVARTLLDTLRTYDATAFPVAAVPLTLNQWVSAAVFLFAVYGLARGVGGSRTSSA